MRAIPVLAGLQELVVKEQHLAHELEEAQARAEEEKARADRLAERLRRLGVDPDQD